jgi:prepilin-type N-terminal cleavage/methylation domain-containing protein
MPTPRNPAGFTLIELMIVIGVLAILSGMAMPILGMARHTARVSETRSLMAKADAAIRQFKGEVGIWPYQSHDPTKSFPEAGLASRTYPDQCRVGHLGGRSGCCHDGL